MIVPLTGFVAHQEFLPDLVALSADMIKINYRLIG